MPTPNQNIELIIANEADKVYLSRIEDIDDDHLVVAAPMENGVLVAVRQETSVLISYKRVGPVAEGRYQASGIIKRRFRQENVPVLLIRLTSDWKKNQQRDFVRVNVLLEGIYNGLNECIVKDLSGGGLLFAAEEELEVGSVVFIDLKLDQNVIRLHGNIVRAVPKESGYEYGMSFINLDEQTRQLIIQFVYKRQIEIHRKVKNQNS